MAFPYTLANDTIADADQVQANFDYLLPSFKNRGDYDNAATYDANDVVDDGAGILWRSLIDDNTGNDLEEGTNWAQLGGAASSFSIDGLTAETTPVDADTLPFYDASASANRKVTFANAAAYVIGKLLGAARTFTNNLFVSGGVFAVGTASPNASAAVQIDSTSKGFAGPRMTTTQRDAISSPLTGLQIYNTTVGQLEIYSGAAWIAVGPAGSGEINTSSNAGSGEGLALAKSGVDLPFKSLVAGTGITLTPSANELEISSTTAIGANDQYDLNRLGSNPASPSAGVMRLFSLAASSFLFWKDSGGTVRSAALAGAATASGLTQASDKLLGRTTAGSGAIEEIAVGDGLALSGGTLDVPAGMPIGGASGQLLAKIDGTDYNTEWVDAPSGGGSWLPAVAVPAEETYTGSGIWQFAPDLGDGDEFEMALDEDNVIMLTPAGTPSDGQVCTFWFWFMGAGILLLPVDFVLPATTTFEGDGSGGSRVRIVAQYKDTSFGGSGTPIGGPYWICAEPEVF